MMAASRASWFSLSLNSRAGSRAEFGYFRPHPLMPGERGGENTSVESVTHYCDGRIVLNYAASQALILQNQSGVIIVGCEERVSLRPI